ncbi:MAG TPA: HAD family hydrolase [Actinoplanes sp.]|nr:HAD family hydrolase [Actinoplanes sp.]
MTADQPAGVLFDVDGTLVDTTYLHAVTWWEALRQHGHDVPMASIHRAIGMGSDRILEHLLGADRDADGDGALAHAHGALYGAWWPRLRPLPGAAQLLRAVAGHGLAVVLASSADARELAVLRRVLDADDVITTATSSADAAQSKPAPDILQAALRQSGVDPGRAVFVGDSVWDVHASAALGIDCIAVACGGTSAAELRNAGAVAVYDDPAELLGALDESVVAKLW